MSSERDEGGGWETFRRSEVVESESTGTRSCGPGDATRPSRGPPLPQDFAFPKPSYNQKMVFLDRAAKRSEAAADAARKAGYANVRTYGGGVKEYEDNAHKHHE